MSSPFRSEAPYLEERLRELGSLVDALDEAAVEVDQERRLQGRPSRLVFLAALVVIMASVVGVGAGRLSSQATAKLFSIELAERARGEAGVARENKEACQSALDIETARLAACTTARTTVLEGGPEVYIGGEPSERVLAARLAFFEIAPAVDPCMGDAREPIVAFVTFASSGEPTGVELYPTRLPQARQQCVVKVIRSARMPAFSGEPLHAQATFTPDFTSLREPTRTGR